jgi:uncharacterized protein YuzE
VSTKAATGKRRHCLPRGWGRATNTLGKGPPGPAPAVRRVRRIRFKYDLVSRAGYIRLRAGRYKESVEIAPGCYLAIDEEGRAVGLEFLSLEELSEFMKRVDGIELPERIENSETFSLKSIA